MSGSAAHVRLLLVEDVAQVSQYIRNLLHAQDQVQLLDVLTDGRQALDQVAQLRPDVLMIDSLLQGKLSGLQLLERVRAAGVDLPVILITVPQRPVKVTPEMGIVRILSMPFSGYDFKTAVQSAKQEHLALSPDSTSRTFVVYGPKGGVGKTTLAFNLAVSMAQLPKLRVALVDGSLQFGDVRALLRVPDSAPSVLQLPTDRVSETDLEQVVWRDPSGIDILLAPPRVEMAEMVTVRDMEKTLSLLKRVYNVVIIDTPTVVNDMVLAYFDASDVIIHLVTADWTTVHNTRLMAQTFEAIGYPMERVCYVLNRAGAPGSIDPRVVVESLGRMPDFTLPSDGRLVVDANNQGVPFVLVEPNAPVSLDVARIAVALTSRPIPAASVAVGR
ncbi:MAG: response regulator [Chloroflexi bacterium]|nr:response regulator [Chloroflexota bacterium]